VTGFTVALAAAFFRCNGSGDHLRQFVRNFLAVACVRLPSCAFIPIGLIQEHFKFSIANFQFKI